MLSIRFNTPFAENPARVCVGKLERRANNLPEIGLQANKN